MSEEYIEDKSFIQEDFTLRRLNAGHYDNCHFDHCNLFESNLSGIIFSDCRFTNCDLSMATIKGTGLQNINFKDCKMLGLAFNECSDFSFEVSFDNCTLNYASFYKRKQKKIQFINCILQEVDFTEAAFSEANFSGSNLLMAKFDNTNLEKADLRTAVNYTIDPTINKLKKAQFSHDGLEGLTSVFGIIVEH